jgi:addiction module HigA family antidote
MNKLQNIHPGEILLEEFLMPMAISQTRLAISIGVPSRRINEIVQGKRGITADTALHLAKVFGTSVQFWMGLQDEYEIREARASTGQYPQPIDLPEADDYQLLPIKYISPFLTEKCTNALFHLYYRVYC